MTRFDGYNIGARRRFRLGKRQRRMHSLPAQPVTVGRGDPAWGIR